MADTRTLSEIVAGLDEKLVRSLFLEALEENNDLCEKFLVKYYAAEEKKRGGKKGGDSDSALERLADDKAESIANVLDWVLDEDPYGRDEDDPLDEASDFARQLADEGRGELAARFANRLAGYIAGDIARRMEESRRYSWGWDIYTIWADILKHSKGAQKTAAFKAMLSYQETCKGDVDEFRLEFLAKNAKASTLDRVLKIMDSAYRAERKRLGERPFLLKPPTAIRCRVQAMRAAGKGGDVEGYLAEKFPSFAFALKIRIECLEQQGDFRGAAALCRELIALDGLAAHDRAQYWRELSRLLKAAGDASGEIEVLREGFRAKASGPDELRRLRELLPENEWRETLSEVMRRMAENPLAQPGFMEAGEIVAEEEDPALLWEYVRRVDKKRLWLAHYDCLCPRHPEAYAECLLRHIEEDPENPGWPDWRTKKTEMYEKWAQNIEQAAAIDGQRDRALEFARCLMNANRSSTVLRSVLTKHGLL